MNITSPEKNVRELEEELDALYQEREHFSNANNQKEVQVLNLLINLKARELSNARQYLPSSEIDWIMDY